jgi:sulfur carrier protein
MTVDLNGHPHDLAAPATLVALIESVAGTTRGSAVVVDGAVVPRSEWAGYTLRDGQRVELITAVQGG